MQTFLPHPDFVKSVKCLDYKRLGKQRVEAYQIINVLEGKGKVNKNGKVAWENHPVTIMWKGYLNALKYYHNCCLDEWIHRGYKNNMVYYQVETPIIYPPWIGDKMFHESHQSNLLRKDVNYYSKNSWAVSDDLPYVWPKP